MSTISKLDPLVRLQRSKRKDQVAGLKTEVRKLDGLIGRGHAKLNAIKEQEGRGLPVSHLVTQPIKDQMSQLFKARVVTQLTLQHITNIIKDPKRTGATKEAILEKFGT